MRPADPRAKERLRSTVCVTVAIVCLLQGCVASMPTALRSGATGPATPTDGGTVAAGAGGCVLGGLAAALLAKTYASAEARRLKLSSAESSKRERRYMLGFAAMGCPMGAYLGVTAYDKLSEQGRQARERELIAAASSAQVRTYTDPGNPSLRGRVTPGPVYADNGRECKDTEDLLSDAGKGEPAVVKICRTPPGGWALATT